MIERSKAVVLRTVNYSETSVICKMYTESHGMLSFIVNGVRSTKARNKAALLKPGNLLELVFYFRENKSLLRLKEYRFKEIYQSIPFDVHRSSILFFFVELVNSSVKEEHQNPELYDFIEEHLLKLDRQNQLQTLLFDFIIGLSAHLGFMPEPSTDRQAYFDLQSGSFTSHMPAHPYFLGGAQCAAFNRLLNDYINDAADRTPMTSEAIAPMMDQLMRFYTLHLERFYKPKSMQVLIEILNDRF